MSNTIYYIDQSITTEFSTRAPKPEEELFFHELATSYQRGYCYLCGDSASLKYLHAHLDGITGSIYSVIRSRYAESGAAINSVQRVFVLTYNKPQDVSSLPEILRKDNKSCFIHIPTAIGANWRLHTECCLLTENLEDGKFYLFMARHYCQEKNIPYRQIRFHRENGGGNTICDVLEKCVSEEKTPVLCLVDSDQKCGTTKSYPNQPAIGDTLNRAQKTSKKLLAKSDVPPHGLFPLYVHEVENLIPIQMLEELEQEQRLGMSPGLKRIIQLREIKGGEPLLYYDFKNGFPYLTDAPQRAYWKELILTLGGDETAIPASKKSEHITYKPELLFFPPLNNKVLQHVLQKIEAQQQVDKAFIQILEIDDYLRNIWNDVGLQILTWGYANEPLRA